MNDIRARLSDADPVRTELSLSGGEAQAMRARVLDAAGLPTVRSLSWPRAAGTAAAVAVTIGAGAAAGRWLAPSASVLSAPQAPVKSVETAERLQLQFATPGGTRIIWTINPDFRVDEVLK